MELGQRRRPSLLHRRRLRADLDRAYHLLEHGLGELDRPRQDLNAIHTD